MFLLYIDIDIFIYICLNYVFIFIFEIKKRLKFVIEKFKQNKQFF